VHIQNRIYYIMWHPQWGLGQLPIIKHINISAAIRRNINIKWDKWRLWEVLGVRGGTVGWGTALHAGRSRVGICRWHNPSCRSMALGWTQPLKEMSTRAVFWGGGVKTSGTQGCKPYHLHMPIVYSRNLGASTSGTPWSCNRPVQGLLYLFL
jgi:hypothetical protein